MDIEGLIMIGLTGVCIAIGNKYEQKPRAEPEPQSQRIERTENQTARGYIANNKTAYVFENGSLKEYLKGGLTRK